MRRMKALAFLLISALLARPGEVYAANPDQVLLTVSVVPDSGPPAPVTDLTAVTGSAEGTVNLTWTAPADDVGVVSYQLYLATFSVDSVGSTESWRTSPGTILWGSVPAPAPPGTTENLTLTGLNPTLTWFFAIRSADAQPFISEIDTRAALGGTPQASTRPASDLLAPAAITNLNPANIFSSSATLTWTAPGDDGTFTNSLDAVVDPAGPGRANVYLIRFATFPITAANFDALTSSGDANGEWRGLRSTAPAGDFGFSEVRALTGLRTNTTYFVAIKTQDEVPNTSLISNTTSFKTLDLIPPAPVGGVTALPTGPARVNLAWTNPADPDFAGVRIRFKTALPFPSDPAGSDGSTLLADLGAGTTNFDHTGLQFGTTYYYTVWAKDGAPNFSTGVSTQATPLQPNPVTLLSVATGQLQLNLAWVNPSQLDFQGVRIRVFASPPFGPGVFPTSATGADGSTLVADVLAPATNFTHTGLTFGTTYQYTVWAFFGNDGNFSDGDDSVSVGVSTLGSPAVAVVSVPPEKAPFVRPTPLLGGDQMRLDWGAVTRNEDGTPVSGLSGYRIYRTTGLIVNMMNPVTHMLLATVGPGTLSFTDTSVSKQEFTWWIVPFNAANLEAEPILVQTDGTLIYPVRGDVKTNVQIPASQAGALRSGEPLNAPYGDNLQIMWKRNTKEETGRVLRSYEIFSQKATNAERLLRFSFEKREPKVALSYKVLSDGTVASPGIAGEGAAPGLKAEQAEKNLAVFWFNGIDWIKIGGKVDPDRRTVTVPTKLLGKFQLRQSLRAAQFTLNDVFPRTFTPNNDGLNDVVNFVFENPSDSAVAGRIFDLHGAHIADMTRGPTPEWLIWDGKDSAGRVVPSGVYLYQVEAEGRVINGAVVVAR